MKLFNLSFNLIVQCLFSLCVFITSTKSDITYFNYTETKLNDSNVTQTVPFVISLNSYDDGTILALITRNDIGLNAACSNYFHVGVDDAAGLEKILRIRVIQLNGTVIEINLDLKLDPPNYCFYKWIPVRIYALQKPFILVTYLNATNSSDPTTYEEWGSVIDWNSNIKSNVRFGLSYVQNDQWSQSSEIHLNVNNKLGFFRLAFEGKTSSYSYGWQQYKVNDSGIVALLKNAIIPTDHFNISIAKTGMATIDGGYAIIYANSTNETTTTNDSFTILGKVYANFISYNRTDEDRTILLYTVNNIANFTGIYCDLVSIGVGQVCIIATNFINFNSNNTANNITKKYIRINFLLSGSLLKVDELSNLPNLTVQSKGWLATSMSYGGYILYANDYTNYRFYYVYAYDEYNIPTDLVSTLSSNQTVPINNFTTNTYGAHTIMKNNNTFLLPTLNTNAQKTSWSLHIILLPKVLKSRDHGFGNLEINQIFPPINGNVDSSYTTINITFYGPVMLSNDPQHGYLTIYKTSDTNVFRQKIPPTSDYCQISLDGKTININILTSTFNEYNQSYYVRMDNNFVKSRIYQEPLKGINDRIWNLISDNKNNINTNSSGYAIVGLASITNDAKSKFLSFSRSERSYYFTQLLNEIAEKVPIRSERLSTDEKFQYINYGKPDEKIIFSINVNLPNSNESTVDSMVSDINIMIFYKRITSLFTGLTNGLDKSYGFIILNDFWVDNKELNIISIMILAIIIILYSLLKDILKIFNVNFNDIEIFHTCLGYAIIAINGFFTAYFVFINSQDKPELFLPSVIIWGIQIGINVFIAIIFIFIFIYNKGKHDFENEENEAEKKDISLSNDDSNSDIHTEMEIEHIIFIIFVIFDGESLIILDNIAEDYIGKILKDVSKTKKFILIKALVEIICKNIPLIVIMAIYTSSIVIYSYIPFMALTTSCLKCFLSIILVCKNIIKYRQLG